MKKTGVTVTLVALALIAVVQVAKEKRDYISPETLVLTSGAFADGDPLPAEYTCAGESLSPPLEWTDVPDSTRSFVLIMQDRDGPFVTWTQWLVYNLPGDLRSLPAGAIIGDPEYGTAREGTNTWLNHGYSAPCAPPVLSEHTYAFHLYALDTTLVLGSQARGGALRHAMDGHIVAEGVLTCTYRR